jgi:hypothetical protein
MRRRAHARTLDHQASFTAVVLLEFRGLQSAITSTSSRNRTNRAGCRSWARPDGTQAPRQPGSVAASGPHGSGPDHDDSATRRMVLPHLKHDATQQSDSEVPTRHWISERSNLEEECKRAPLDDPLTAARMHWP